MDAFVPESHLHSKANENMDFCIRMRLCVEDPTILWKNGGEMKLGKIIGYGWSSDVFEYGSDKVIKLFKNKNSIRSSDTMAYYEYRKTKKIFENGLPAPEVFDFIKYGDRYGFVLEKIDGHTLYNEIAFFLSNSVKEKRFYENAFRSEQVSGIIRKMAKTLSIIHNTQHDFDQHGFMDTLDVLLEKTFSNYDTEAYKIFSSLPEGHCILHTDFHLDNIIYADDKLYLVDWLHSTIGNHMFDVANIVNMFEEFASGKKDNYDNDFFYHYKDKAISLFLDEYKRQSGMELLNLEEWQHIGRTYRKWIIVVNG